MNIPKELRLQKATIVQSSNIATKDGMKTVLNIEAPLGKSSAEVLGCDHLFNRNGSPRDGMKKFSFEGKLESIKCEFPVGENDLVELKPEKIGGIHVRHVADVGLVLTMRVHILNDILTADSLYDRKRDSEFHLVIRPLQKGLFDQAEAAAADESDPEAVEGEPEAEPHEGGKLDDSKATSIPFTGHKKITAEILVADVEDGFAVGWHAQFKFRHKLQVNEPLTINSPVAPSEQAAIERGAIELATFVRAAKAVRRSDEETAALDALFAWLETKGTFGSGPKAKKAVHQ